jgi:tRNA dimethylallyltransferase
VPVFCGGTGLYFRALREGLGAAPPADAALRAELEQQPLAALLAELDAADPVTAARIDRRNPRRVVRAVEVLRLTGRPLAELRAGWQAGGAAGQPPLFVLRRAAADLKARLRARVAAMFAAGLVAEVRALLAAGVPPEAPALQAIGYRQVAGHLAGRHDLAATQELVAVRTRQYAKRQMTWFRALGDTAWLDVPAGEAPEETARRVLAQSGAQGPR